MALRFGCAKSDQDLINDEIEKGITISKREEQKIYKCLLLGTGGCGKSTFLKQMKVIENQDGSMEDPFPLRELEEKWRPIIFFNIFDGIRTIVRQMENLRIKFDSDANKGRGRDLLEIQNFDGFIDGAGIRLDYAMKVKELWEDSGVRKCFERRAEYQLEDSTQYFLDNMDQVLIGNYVPTVEHVLHARVKTTTIYTQDIPLRNRTTLRMIDVGGQRCYREKWIHYFDNVVTIIFITSLSEFNLKLEEDQTVSRAEESLSLFEKILENQYFLNTCIILFLNKKDLMEQKLKEGINFQDYFPEYDPDEIAESEEYPKDADYPKEAEFMRQLYLERDYSDTEGDESERMIFSHITCATDTRSVRIIWDVVKTTILENALKVIVMN